MKRCLIVLALFLSPIVADAACVSAPSPCVNDGSAVVNTTGGGPATAAYSGSNVAGHLLVAAVTYGNNNPAITDTAGNSWTLAVGANNGTATQIFYVCNAIAGANSVTATITSSQFLLALRIYEFSGTYPSSGCLDATGASTGSANDGTVNGTISTSGSVAQASELVFAAFAGNHGSVTTVNSNSPAIDLLTTTTTNFYQSIARDAMWNATTGLSGVQTVNATSDVASSFWANAIATFKISAPTGRIRHRINETEYHIPDSHHSPLLFARAIWRKEDHA